MPQVLVNNVYFCRKERAALQLKHSVPVPACAIHDHGDSSDHKILKVRLQFIVLSLILIENLEL